jgi:membrane-associated phospholipid phosphatase
VLFGTSQIAHVLTVLRHSIRTTWCGLLVFGAANAVAAPTVSGQSGYINMPSAAVGADGTFSTGYGYDTPYSYFWASATVFPFLQATARYVSVNGIPGFVDASGAELQSYGRYKDKVVDAKLRLLQESTWLPEVAVGATDLFGTELFKGHYIVATKTFGTAKNFEASIGYGSARPQGVFAGARWMSLDAPGWAVVAEYDANDYKKDFRASETDAGTRSKGPALGVEYRWGWLGAQVARHRDHFSANAYITIPFNEREFIPKIYEPKYFQAKDAPAPVTTGEWQANPAFGAALVQALAKQDFKNIRIELDRGILKLTLTNNRISNMGRAVGRATRTALAYAPQGTRAIHVTYTKLEQPIATYEFFDMKRLTDYFTGLVDRNAFLQTVLVRYATPADRIGDEQGMLVALKEDNGLTVQMGRDGNMVQLGSEDREDNRFKVVPKFGFFFNDPSGALRYELAAAANYDKRLREGLYFNSVLRASLFENISGVTQASNSLLPHVRTDIAEYKRGGRFKLNKAMLNQYMQPAERVYARVSGGFYEEMYRGFGGQILYLPKDSRWATDLTVDALQQRGYEGWLGKRDYKTVTALGALHYKLPYDVAVTARVGRFLARDTGARIEFKRRFQSGIEIGAWYAHTNGNDITNPGAPGAPYHDKGVFLSIPLNSMLPMDSQANAGIAISPWTRDVGQMVASPGDLYDMVEQPRRDLNQVDGLGNFAERADEQGLAAINPPTAGLPSPWPAFRMRLEQSTSSSPTLPEWARGTALAGGAVLASALLDKPADRFVKNHAASTVLHKWGNAGKAMPVVLVGAAGAALAFGDERLQNIGLISLQAVAASVAVSYGAKYVVGRSRPGEEQGPWRQVSGKRSDASFPSGHSAVAFAAVTPFAQEYDAPWLYGVAALSAAGRVADRQHWVSDVVAGSVVGYVMGSWLWQSQRDQRRSSFSIQPGPKQISVAWQTTY